MADRAADSVLWRRFLEAHAAVTRALEAELRRRVGIPLTWLEVLLELDGAPDGALRMRELARRVLLTRSGVTRLVDRMQQAGLVRRETCPTDRRGTYAVLTEAGRELLRRVGPVHLEGVRRYFTGVLTPEEARVLEGAFGRIIAASA